MTNVSRSRRELARSAESLPKGKRGAYKEFDYSRGSFKAYCVCGKNMVDTTPADVKAGKQPRCPKCPKEKKD